MVASRLQARGVRAKCQSQLCPFPPVTLTRPHGKKNAAVVLVAGGACLLSAGMTIVAPALSGFSGCGCREPRWTPTGGVFDECGSLRDRCQDVDRELLSDQVPRPAHRAEL
jgi:hypothetical protein